MKKNKCVLPAKPREVKAPALRIVYPKPGETITAPVYTVHVAAVADCARMDIAVDQGEWQPCRESLGLWWFDWAGYAPGLHQLVVRARLSDGDILLSEQRQVLVKEN